MPDPRWSPGSRLGRYDLVACLGRGGAGEVWHAVLNGPHGFRRHVALKLLLADPSNPEARALLIREARLGAFLSHPNIVATYELDEVDGALLIAMELVRGAPLSRMAAPLPPRLVVDVGMQVCAGLQHVHTLALDDGTVGLVHRDIKPANLLADRSGVVKIADLGIARLVGGAVPRASGTPGFMPYEQALGQEDGRADLFALGATLCVLTLGSSPFGQGRSALEAVVCADEIVLHRSFASELDALVPGLGPVVVRCLRAEAADRWPDAQSLARALAELRPRLAPGVTMAALLPDAGGPDQPITLSDVVDTEPRMPRPAGRWVGRGTELAAVATGLQSERRWLALVGPGGIGKSRLALEALYAERPRVRWVDLAEVGGVDGVLRAVAVVLGVRLDVSDPLRQIGRALLAGGRITLVLDDADRVVDRLRPLIDEWLAAAPELRVVTTSRAGGVHGAERIVVGPLSNDDGRELFGSLCSKPLAEPDVAAIVDRLDGVPLAIELAAGAGRPEALLDDLHHSSGRLALTDETRPARHRSLRASIAASVACLEADDAEALYRLTVFESPFQPDHALKVAGISLAVLDRLAEAWLVRFDVASQRFSLPADVWALAAERLDPDDRWVAELRHGQLFAWYGTDEAIEALHRLGGADRTRELRRSIDDLAAAATRAVDRRDGRIAVAAAIAAHEVWLPQGGLALAERYLLAACGVASGADLHRVQRKLALLWLQLGRTEEAGLLLQEVHRVAAAEGDPATIGRVGLGLARMAQVTGRPAEAEALYRQAIDRLHEAGALREEGMALGHLGSVVHQDGRLDEAEAIHRRALAIHREVGDRVEEGVRMSNLGSVLSDRGDRDGAFGLYCKALAIHRAFGDRTKEAMVLANLGNHCVNAGDLREGERWIEQALGIQRASGLTRPAGVTSLNLGIVSYDLGRLDAARDWFETSRALGVTIADPRVEGLAQFYLGRLGVLLGAEGALRQLEAGTVLVRRGGERRFDAYTRIEAAAALRTQGELVRADTMLAEAAEVVAALDGAPLLPGLLHVERALNALAHGRVEDAGEAIEAAAGYLLHLADPLEQARLAAARAEVARASGADPSPFVGEVRAAITRSELLPSSPLGRWLSGFTAELRG